MIPPSVDHVPGPPTSHHGCADHPCTVPIARETQNKCLAPARTPGNRSIFGHIRTPAAPPGVLGPSRGPSGRPRGTPVPSAAVRRPPRRPPGTPPASRPWRTRAGWRRRAGRGCGSRSSRCRGSGPSRSRRSAWRSGRGACPRAHGGLGAAPPRGRPPGPPCGPGPPKFPESYDVVGNP